MCEVLTLAITLFLLGNLEWEGYIFTYEYPVKMVCTLSLPPRLLWVSGKHLYVSRLSPLHSFPYIFFYYSTTGKKNNV